MSGFKEFYQGFKAFYPGLKAQNGFQFKVGETYTQTGELKFCENGFHFCEFPLDLDRYFKPRSFQKLEYALVEILGDVKHDINHHKSITNKIKIVKRISRKSFFKYFNNGKDGRCETKSGDAFYIKNGKLHRDGLCCPAIWRKNGTLEWYHNGRRHRECGKDGIRKPAIKKKNGTLIWYKDGILYNDGNAHVKIDPKGKKYWYDKKYGFHTKKIEKEDKDNNEVKNISGKKRMRE
jgi:hypothetical protein